MEPKIEDGVLVVVDVDTDHKHAKPSYIRAASIDGVRHRDDSTCWIDYGAHMFVARGSAATISALVWPRKAERPPLVIGPWQKSFDGWVRRLDGREYATAYPHDTSGWIWTAGVESGRCGNEQEAKDRADMALTPIRLVLS